MLNHTLENQFSKSRKMKYVFKLHTCGVLGLPSTYTKNVWWLKIYNVNILLNLNVYGILPKHSYAWLSCWFHEWVTLNVCLNFSLSYYLRKMLSNMAVVFLTQDVGRPKIKNMFCVKHCKHEREHELNNENV